MTSVPVQWHCLLRSFSDLKIQTELYYVGWAKNNNKQNPNRCHHPLITQLSLDRNNWSATIWEGPHRTRNPGPDIPALATAHYLPHGAFYESLLKMDTKSLWIRIWIFCLLTTFFRQFFHKTVCRKLSTSYILSNTNKGAVKLLSIYYLETDCFQPCFYLNPEFYS